MSDAALVIRGLEKRFAKFALGPLDVTVPKGETSRDLSAHEDAKSQ